MTEKFIVVVFDVSALKLSWNDCYYWNHWCLTLWPFFLKEISLKYVVFYVGSPICWIIFIFQMCFGEGTISIRLTKYSNKDGKGNNGNCCESKWHSNCHNPCDHYFILCLDRPGGPPAGVDHCPMGKKTTGSIGQNVIIFNNVIDGTPNPVKFPFEKWLVRLNHVCC